MKVTNRYLMTAADLPSGSVEKLKKSIQEYDLKNRKNPNEGSVLPTTEPTDTGLRAWKLTNEESNLLRGFRLEEYVELTERMKKSDPEAYRLHKKRLQDAEDSGDTGAEMRERVSPYIWAYGDILDLLHKENPDLDIFIRSAGTPKDFEFRSAYHKKNNRPYLIISTNEIRQLQSNGLKDKLWNDIRARIKQ
ncbi:MAG: hypothetical protein HDR24_03695 [Lachnospiraceae bacterium]|nr:hypothetical protein [Lachnospiraceae bacterium]MDE7444813.1 hypothetical protein [Lachnospiraceae bacterium]